MDCPPPSPLVSEAHGQELGEVEVSVPISHMGKPWPRDTGEFSIPLWSAAHIRKEGSGGPRPSGRLRGGHSTHRAVSVADMDVPLPDEVLRCGGRLTHIPGEPQDRREDRAAHLELQPRHGSFW